MSFWAKLGVNITDLGCFRRSCEQHDIEYTEVGEDHRKMQGMTVHAVLRDKQGGSSAFLCREGGGYRMVVDTDKHYSSITNRCGTKITRDYAVNVVRKGVTRSGGVVNGVTENPDGSVVMRIAAAG